MKARLTRLTDYLLINFWKWSEQYILSRKSYISNLHDTRVPNSMMTEP